MTTLPDGTLLASRVVRSLSVPLETCLEARFTGYLRVESGVPATAGKPVAVTVEDGVPTAAVVPDGDRTGAAALATLPETGPFRVERTATASDELARLRDRPACRIDPGTVAERTDSPDLAARTRDRAPEDPDDDPVAAFLDDPERIAELRREARTEAAATADEWGLADQLDSQ